MIMTIVPNVNDQQSLHDLSWNYAQDGKCAIDLTTGLIVDVNPAMETLMGYSRAELIGMRVNMLHPEAERKPVEDEFRKATQFAAPHLDFHIQQKDGNCVPVALWSSEKLELAGRSMAIVEFRDITDQKQKEHLLSTQNWALTAFSIASVALGRARSADALLQYICEAITHQSPYVFAWVGIAEDGPEKKIRIAASAGSAASYLDGLHLSWSADQPWGRSPAGICIRTGVLQLVNDTEKSPTFDVLRKRSRKFGIRSSVSVPLLIEGVLQGALIVYGARPNIFEDAPIQVFQRLSEQIVHGVRALEQQSALHAGLVDLAKAQKQLAEALSAAVTAIVTAMEMRDPYTSGHESRVAEIACAIAKEMGFGEHQLQGLRMAAMVHDIGKISIPSEILTKPAKLSKEEYDLIKTHPEAGYAILRDIPFTWPVAEIVRQHHEKLDGSGYPFGLKVDAILPEAKILAVADIVEAMASDRPYRATLGLEVALAEINALSGTLLDPDVVRVCTDLFREKRLVMPGLELQ
jgi:PAS domain S-box-containing protein/putative nucleotidyltransferase with HDIG domain